MVIGGCYISSQWRILIMGGIYLAGNGRNYVIFISHNQMVLALKIILKLFSNDKLSVKQFKV